MVDIAYDLWPTTDATFVLKIVFQLSKYSFDELIEFDGLIILGTVTPNKTGN